MKVIKYYEDHLRGAVFAYLLPKKSKCIKESELALYYMLLQDTYCSLTYVRDLDKRQTKQIVIDMYKEKYLDYIKDPLLENMLSKRLIRETLSNNKVFDTPLKHDHNSTQKIIHEER